MYKYVRGRLSEQLSQSKIVFNRRLLLMKQYHNDRNLSLQNDRSRQCRRSLIMVYKVCHLVQEQSDLSLLHCLPFCSGAVCSGSIPFGIPSAPFGC